MLVPAVTGPETAAASAAIHLSLRDLDLHRVDLVVIASAHGESSGVYKRVAGSLDGFGLTGLVASAQTDPHIARSVAASWDMPLLDEPADYGIVVPLLMGFMPDVPVVGLAFADITRPAAANGVVEQGRALAPIVRTLAEDHSVAFLASANLAAALSPRAPLTERTQAIWIERRFVAALERDTGEIATMLEDLTETGGSCGAGPLATFAALFEGRAAEVLAHEHPLGVGYVVAGV